MEAFYRLLLSALSVPWRSYIMARDVQLFSFLWTKDEECFYANIFYTYLFVAYIIHHTGGSLIRYNLFYIEIFFIISLLSGIGMSRPVLSQRLQRVSSPIRRSMFVSEFLKCCSSFTSFFTIYSTKQLMKNFPFSSIKPVEILLRIIPCNYTSSCLCSNICCTVILQLWFTATCTCTDS